MLNIVNTSSGGSNVAEKRDCERRKLRNKMRNNKDGLTVKCIICYFQSENSLNENIVKIFDVFQFQYLNTNIVKFLNKMY